MTNSELAAWIAGKLPEENLLLRLQRRDRQCPIEHIKWWFNCADMNEDTNMYEAQQVAIGLMLDALAGHGCEYRIEGPDSHGKHLCWVATENPPPDAMSAWDVRRFGDSRYAAVRAACEAVAEGT